MRRSIVVAVVASALLYLACDGETETDKESTPTTQDGGSSSGSDGSSGVLDATIIEAGGPVPIVDASDRPCSKDDDCKGGTCFEGMCMCQAPKYVQPDGRCGDDAPPECTTSSGTCRQNPAECMAGELEGELSANQTCGDFVAAVCCYPSSACKGTADILCCGASTTPYEPRCVNGWRTCLGLQPKLRSSGSTCP